VIDGIYARSPSRARIKKINKQKSTQTELEIISIGGRGDGVGELEGKSVFVPFSLAGENVLINKNGNRGKILKIIKSSPNRIAPFCSHFTRCGGCVVQHLPPDIYRSWKKEIVKTALDNQGLDVQIDDLIDAHGNGRRRVSLHVLFDQGIPRAGFMKARSHDLFEFDECPVLVSALNEATKIARSLSSPLSSFSKKINILITAFECGLDCDIQIPIKFSELDINVRIKLADVAAKFDLARVTVSGDIIVERRSPMIKIGKAYIFPPPNVFLQATLAGEKLLADFVLAYAFGAYKVADLFCGIGPFSLRLANASSVLAVDFNEAQISTLSKAARNCQGLKPIITEVRDLFSNPYRADELSDFDCVIFNPPRAGAKAQAGEISKSKVPIVIAVSCDPASFARDSAILACGGYSLEKITPIDQFKFTRHVEMVALFQRKGEK